MGNTSSVPAEGKLPDALSVPVAPSYVVDGLQTTPILRGAGMEGKPLLKTAFPDATTLYGAFQRGLRVARDQPCLGHRIPAEDGSLTTEYDWKTYEQVAELRDIIGSEMVRRDWLPEVEDQGITVRPFGLFSKNRWEWTTACMAGDAYGGVSVALYDTLGEEALTHILEQTEIRVVFAGLDQLKILLKVRTADPEKTSKLTNVVSFGKPDDETLAAADKAGLEIVDLADLIAVGREHEVKAHTPPKPEDVATINYTSGTTSLPKGAVLTHVNMVSSVCNALSIVDKVMGDKPSDWVHLSYLPASHIFERGVQALFVLMGGRIGFFCGDIRQLSGDLTSLRPTMFPTVPRLLSRFKDKVALNISKASTVVQTLYGWGYEAKKANLEADGTTTHSIYDRLVFSGVAAKLGLDRCKLMASGSAPLAEEVHQFFRTVLPGVPLVEAYGLTETAPSVTAADVRDTMTTGHVGSPLPSCEVRLMSVPDLDYYSTDHIHRLDGKPLKRGPAPAADAGGAAASAASGGAADAEAAGGGDGEGDSSPACELPGEILSDQEGSALLQCEGRGELQVRGMNVFSGYFKAPDKTKAAFTSDGWFRTGDIAICLKGSRKIKIVDRLKNIFKLAQGEYVAPEKVEGKVQGTKVVLMAWVYGDSKKSACVCVAVPDPDTFPSYCIEKGFSKAGKPEDVDVKAMCALPEVRASVLSDMTDVCKQCGLTGFERPRALRLEPNPWMPGTEEMTPSFKLKRHQLKLRYQDQLDEMYAELASGGSKGAAGAAKGGAKGGAK